MIKSAFVFVIACVTALYAIARGCERTSSSVGMGSKSAKLPRKRESRRRAARGIDRGAAGIVRA